MKHVREVDFHKDGVVIRYVDDDDPEWVRGHELALNVKKHPHVDRLLHVAYHVFALFVNDPQGVSANDEVLQEWIGRLLVEQPEDGHDSPIG